MASFTDIVPKFRDYVPKLPLEAIVQAGMYKQQKYEENVKAIQGQIDKVAGMDIMRDVDKAYLQSKLNELGNNLTGVAAGDFSNFQLANSVGGMANQISSDRHIQTAVSSTAWARKQLADMDDARKQGKSSVMNQYDFNQKLNNYVSSTDLGRSFKDTYTPFIDVDKKAMDVIKALHPGLTEQDIPYERNADGSLNYNKIAAAMSRVTKETVSAAQIENAIRANLSPDDLNQLAINGRYQFRGYDVPEKLQNVSITRYNGQIAEVDKQINALQGYASLTTSNPAEHDKTLKTIESLRQMKVTMKSNLESELNTIGSDLDGAKATIYKNGWVSEFSNAFAWETKKTNLLTNPVLEAKHWEQKFALDQSEFGLRQAQFSWTKYKDQHDMNLADKDFQLKMDKQMADLYGTSNPYHTYLGESTLVKDPVTAMKQDLADKLKGSDDIINAMKKVLPASTIAGIEESLTKYANGDVKAIPVEWRKKADEILANRRDAKVLQATITKTENEVRNSTEFKNGEAAIDKLIKDNDLPSLTVTEGGVKYSFTPKEIATYNAMKIARSQASPGGVGYASIAFSRPLTPKEQILEKFDPQTKGLYDIKLEDLGGGNKNRNLVGAVLNRYSTALGNTYNKHMEAFDAAVTKALLPRSGKYVGVVSDIGVSDKDGATSAANMRGFAMDLLLKYDKAVGGTAGGAEGVDIAKARGWLAGDGKADIQFKKVVQGDKTILMLVKGNEQVGIPMEPLEAIQLPTYKHEPSPFQKQVTSMQYMGDGGTNVTGDPTISLFQRNNFTNVKKMGVTGDLHWDESNPGMNYLNLNLRLPSGWKYLKIDDYPMDADQAQKFIQSLSDKDIKQLYLNNPDVPDEWKQEIQATYK